MKHVLITGGSRGIGRACAEYCGEQGWSVTAVARGAIALEALADHWREQGWPGALHLLVADLTTEKGRNAIPATGYDAVVLNAAEYRPGRLLDETDVFADLLALNVHANHLLARRLVPGLLKRSEGRLVVIGSLGTDTWPSHMTAYVATKYALRGLYEGWHRDLADTGVKVSLIAPAATLTSSWAGETPPTDILSPRTVALAVGDAIAGAREGRVVVRG
ncbi:MAG: SDR family NAD(P)-dependent oxidoreductase [Bacteroidota bacterium]